MGGSCALVTTERPGRGRPLSSAAERGHAATRSTARSRAERARGLAAISSASALDGAPGELAGTCGSAPQPQTGRSGGHTQPELACANRFLTIRSSSE